MSPPGPMDALPPTERRFGEKDIGRIIRRASQLQRETPTRPDPSGLTLAELEEIAREAGIDPDNIRRAVAELGTVPESDLLTRLLGAPLTVELEQRLAGELDPDAFDTLVPILQTGADATGQASTVGKALTWTSTGGNNARRLQVLVIAQDGETRVRLEERSWEVALAFHMGFGFGSFGLAIPGGMALGAAAGVLAGLGGGLAIVGAFYGIARASYRMTSRRRRAKLESLFTQLVERVQAGIERHRVAGVAGAEALPPGAGPAP